MRLRYYRYSAQGGIQKLKTRAGLAVSALALTIGGGASFATIAVNAASADSQTVCATACTTADVQAALDSANAGSTVSFAGDVTLDKALIVNKSLTIEGNGHTVSTAFTATSPSNNAAFIVTGSDVTLTDLTVDGTNGSKLHGVNVYKANGVSLNNVTLQNNSHNGLVVNGSTVTVNNLVTRNDGWGGVDVDLGSGVTTPAKLIVTGVSNQYEAGNVDIFVDNTSKDVSVVDNNNQYFAQTVGVGRVYELTPTIKQQCKDGNWMQYLVDRQGGIFKNQGACVSYVASNGKSQH